LAGSSICRGAELVKVVEHVRDNMVASRHDLTAHVKQNERFLDHLHRPFVQMLNVDVAKAKVRPIPPPSPPPPRCLNKKAIKKNFKLKRAAFDIVAAEKGAVGTKRLAVTPWLLFY
jgi:hypothetical protein